ncbi:aminotransferase class V-fold PLP-dependent enzyme [Agathobaculum sp.]|jgi:cysteine desulfurase|uniref:cysteine desulfurase family protein n=1 Tax=Agathobaculum sp. TaxID=2048138 RepID=UPI000E5454F2|nr:aminotransferase class V-fold PLP-dependent enzyme [Butyricicoccus sp. AM42-5AC]RHT49835.1 aminotransferase class V-fold PLP-dependent enzyme [Butyricicoccus sp. AM29-23AC]RHV44288.1 aminotransferase class V-fold PLP-dependent enzyme [Butyricicoccus sp. OM04-18BH]
MEKRFVYADNAATTPLSEIAFNAMKPWLTEHYGNPSSLYRMGREAKEAINEARKVVGKCLNAAMPVNEKNDYAPGEILFTGGGSQADNLAIRGFMHGPSSKGRKHIITSKIEHHAVLYTCEALEKEGFRVTYLNVDKEGHVDLEQLKRELSEDTALVSIMAANNEIGTIQPLKQISELAHSVGAKFHTDAVQAVGHMHIDVQEMGIDMLSLAGHKFRGPRGTGVLYVKNGIQLEPLVYGGGQERGLVSGTENTAGFIGLAAAMQDACEHLDEKMGYVKKLTDKLVKGIMENIPYSHYTGDPVNRLPGTASFVFEAIEGEGLILRLDNAGVCGSTGSACSTGSLDPSHVLMAIGLPHEIAHGSLRLTLGEQNTEEDVDYVIETVTDVVKTLRSMSPVWENGKPNLSAAADLTAHH